MRWGEAPDEPHVSFAPLRLAGTLAPPACASPSRVHSFAEFGRGEAGGFGQFGDVLDSRIAPAAFDVADLGGIKAGFLGQFFLGELFCVALAADVAAQRGEDAMGFRHDS